VLDYPEAEAQPQKPGTKGITIHRLWASFKERFLEEEEVRRAKNVSPWMPQHDASAGRLWEPLPPTDCIRNSTVFPQPMLNPEPIVYFLSAIRSSLQATRPLEANTPTGCWLSALIHMQVISCAGALDRIIQESIYSDDERAGRLFAMGSALESSLRQIAALQGYFTQMQASDYAQPLHELQRLVKEIKVHQCEVNDLLNARFRVKSSESAELTVRESRSAIARKITAC
jgi:hypothetical protein